MRRGDRTAPDWQPEIAALLPDWHDQSAARKNTSSTKDRPPGGLNRSRPNRNTVMTLVFAGHLPPYAPADEKPRCGSADLVFAWDLHERTFIVSDKRSLTGMQEALAALLGKDAPNLSPAVLARLKAGLVLIGATSEGRMGADRIPGRLSRERPILA
jgi:hypothetical protein